MTFSETFINYARHCLNSLSFNTYSQPVIGETRKSVYLYAWERPIGSAIGKQSFLETYVQQKVDTWVEELKRLATIQPHKTQTGHLLLLSHMVALADTPSIANLLKPRRNESTAGAEQ